MLNTGHENRFQRLVYAVPCRNRIRYHRQLGAIPAYAKSLEDTLGMHALSTLKQDADQPLDQCLACAKQIYDNFMANVRSA